MFQIGFDIPSLQKITELEGMGALLDVEIVNALAWSGELVTTTAKANTWTAFQHPTGQTADSIGFTMVSASEAAITVGVPQGRRLEYGFSGMTDSLGRTFPYWPAEPYMQPALDSDRALIEEKMMLAIENVIARVEGL